MASNAALSTPSQARPRPNATVTVKYRRPLGPERIVTSHAYSPTPREFARELATRLARAPRDILLRDLGFDLGDELGRRRVELRSEVGVFGDVWGMDAGELRAALDALRPEELA